MARIDVTKTKRDIDFDVYEKQDPNVGVNWAQEAENITKAFTDVAKDRQKRKDDIDADTKSNLDKLNEIDSYDNQTLMNMTIDGTNNAANVIYEAERRMKNGDLRPQDFQKIKQNISSGFTQFQKNAKQWESDFAAFQERMGNDTSSSLEQYLGERAEAFGNLKNLQLVTNPETGNLAFGRIDESGNLLTGPDDLISINRMTAMLKQKIDKVDVGGAVDKAVTGLGDYITAGNATTMGKDGTGPRAVLTVDDFMQTPEADTYLNEKAAAICSNDFQTGSILSDSGAQNSLGETYRGGDQAQFDQWNKDNPGKEDQNPIIVMGYKKNGVIVEPAITEGQQTAAEAYIKRQLEAKLGREEKLTTKQVVQKSGTQIGLDDRNDQIFGYLEDVDLLVTGNKEQRDAAGQSLIENFNKENPNSPTLQSAKWTGENTLTIKVDGKQDVIVDTEGKSADEVRREVFTKITPKGVGTYQSAVSKYKGNLGENIGTGLGGGTAGQDRITYNRVPLKVIDKDSGKEEEVNAVDWMTARKQDLGTTLAFYNDRPEQVENKFNELLGMNGFLPPQLQENSSIKVVEAADGTYKMVVNIGETTEEISDIYSDNESVTKLVGMVQSFIEKEVSRFNSGVGGSGGADNKKKSTPLSTPDGT